MIKSLQTDQNDYKCSCAGILERQHETVIWICKKCGTKYAEEVKGVLLIKRFRIGINEEGGQDHDS